GRRGAIAAQDRVDDHDAAAVRLESATPGREVVLEHRLVEAQPGAVLDVDSTRLGARRRVRPIGAVTEEAAADDEDVGGPGAAEGRVAGEVAKGVDRAADVAGSVVLEQAVRDPRR